MQHSGSMHERIAMLHEIRAAAIRLHYLSAKNNEINMVREEINECFIT
jgi:hypothetical protein